MNWEAIGAIGEILGAVTVLGTLAYLAVQIRQNTAQTKLDSIQAINASNDSAFDPIYLGENTRIFTKGQASYAQLDDHEKVVFDMLMMRLAASFDATTYQFVHGAYDDELYEGSLKFYATFMASPGGQQWLAFRKESIGRVTLENLEKAIVELRNAD